jgi:predicted TPR repeat methyltransferase
MTGDLRPGGRFAFTVELLEEGPDYRLLPAGRFAHSRAYIQGLATRAQLQELGVTPAMIRTEEGRGVAGLVVVLSRQPT